MSIELPSPRSAGRAALAISAGAAILAAWPQAARAKDANAQPPIAQPALVAAAASPSIGAANAAPIATAAVAPLLDEVVVRGGAIDRVLPDAMGAKLFAGKKTTNVNLDELAPLASGQAREALALLPGLLVSEVSNRAWASFSYRGLGEPHESWNTLILADGMAVSPDPYNYPAAYYTPPLDAVERIEFVRGGASLLYGPQPGGALNYVLRRAPTNETGAALSAALGSDGFSNLYASGWTGLGRVGLQGYVSRVEGDGPRRANSDFLTETASLALTAEDGAWTVSTGLDLYRGDFGEPGGLSRARYAADPAAESTPVDRFRAERVAARLAAAYDAGDWLFEARAHGVYFDRASRRQAGGAFGETTPAANVAIVQSQKFRTATLDLRARRDFSAWNADHALTFGMTAFASSAPVTVDKGASPTDWEGAAGPIARARRESVVVAGFGELALDFGRLTVTPGARVERLSQEVRETLELATGSATGGPPGAPLGPLQSRENEEWVVLPGLGLSYDLGETHEAYLNLTRGFKPLLFNDGQTFQSGVNAAATFESSDAESAEIGLRGRIGDVATYDVSAFHIRLENQIGFLAGPLPASGAFGAVGPGGARRQNVGTMENSGLDLALEVELTELFGAEGETQVLAFANASLLEAQFVEGPARGFRPQYAPETFLRGGLIARFGERARLQVSGSYLSEHSGADNAAAEFRIPAYAVFDATGEVTLAEGAALFAAINNVFDRRYFARVRPGGGQGIDPGAPRTVTAGLRVRY